MKVFSLLSLAYLATLVSAYGLYGAYERLFFYYAYLIDAEQNGGNAKVIASGCAKAQGATKTGKCNFNQFVEYINKKAAGQDKPFPVSITTDPMPDIDKTADALYAAKPPGQTERGLYCRDFDFGRIMQKVHTDSGSLTVSVAKYIELTGHSGTKSQLAGARTAITRVQFLRGEANLDAARTAILEARPDAKIFYKTAKLYSGGPDYTIFNKAETIGGNPSDWNLQGVVDQMNKDDPVHFDNVAAATESRARMAGCMKEK